MRCPTLAELPPPPPGKSGWPWTVETPQLPDVLPDGRPWPRISIVTPSFNQGQFIEETIRSVLLQGYPDLEYVIIDGGSTDEAAEIIKKYEIWLKYWVSEKDRGQSHAINKGFEHATGEWGNWLNSDDVLLPTALYKVATACGKAPRSTEGLCFGCRIVTADRIELITRWQLVPVKSVYTFLHGGLQPMAQPSTFRKLSSMSVQEDLHYAMDWALYFSIIEHNNQAFYFFYEDIAEFRIHKGCKTKKVGQDEFLEEEIRFVRDYKFSHKRDKWAALLWARKKTAHLQISQDSVRARDCVRVMVSYPEIVLDRMFLGRLRQLLVRDRS